MNKVEIRVNNIKNALDYSNYEIDEIGIGNEGCLLKIPSLEQINYLVKSTDKCIKLVLPFVPQCHIRKIKYLLNEITREKLKMSIVINDLGILSYLQSLDIDNLSISIGRFLDWSYSLVPWGDNILRNESSEVFNYAMQSSLFDNKKLDLFKKMGVTGVELNATKRNIELSGSFKKLGFNTYLHCGYNILATSRACAYKRMQDPVKCTKDCDEIKEFTISKKWLPNNSFAENNDNFAEDEEVKSAFPKLYMKNNMIFCRNGYSLDSLVGNKDINVIINEELVKSEEDFNENRKCEYRV